MAQVLRRLNMLVTSRYHAQVLAMPVPVPTVAVSKDERLRYIDTDMGLDPGVILDVTDKSLAQNIGLGLDYLVQNREHCQGLMRSYRERSLLMLQEMLDTLETTAVRYYPAWKAARHEG